MLCSIKGLETMLSKIEIKTSSKDNKDYIIATFLSFAGGDSFNIMIKDMDMLSKLKQYQRYELDINLNSTNYGLNLSLESLKEI